MRTPLLDQLRCPDCGSRLDLAPPVTSSTDGEVDTGVLACQAGHAFPVVRGIPRLYPGAPRDFRTEVAGLAGEVSRDGSASEQADLRRTQESFSREWGHHRLGDRTWYLELRERVRGVFLDALRIPEPELRSKTVLDAGCGNGSQSVAYTEYVDTVIAVDLSTGVELGYAFRSRWPGAHPDRVHFVQADIQRPPLAPGSVDIVHCAGVLHHTPDTRASFRALVPLLRPGGTCYVWVYRYEPVVTPLLKQLRRVTTRVPLAIFERVCRVAAVPFLLFTRAVTRLGVRPYPRISRREATVALMDIFSPTYAHSHSPPEVRDWFAAEGFTETWVTDESRRGFAVCGRLPGA